MNPAVKSGGDATVVYTAEEIAGVVDRIAREVAAWAGRDELAISTIATCHGTIARPATWANRRTRIGPRSDSDRAP